MDAALKPCPFCGGTVREQASVARPMGDAPNCEVQYLCFTCGTFFKIPFTAITHEGYLYGRAKAWNRRA